MQTGHAQHIIQEILTTEPPSFSEAEATAVAAAHFGIRGNARVLVSERDQNFQLRGQDGLRYTLKISNHAESQDVIDFQNQALQHVLKQDDSLPLPRIVSNVDGQLHDCVERDGKTHFIRVLSWLEGSIIHNTTVDAPLAYRLGQLLARLDAALRGFDHPGAQLPLLWDMKRADNLADLITHIREPGEKRLIARTLDRFVSSVKPALVQLRTQVIHNDMNPGNVLMDLAQPDRIAGVIDFGDMTRSPLIIDLAVAVAYQLGDGADPLAAALPMIAGYHSVEPLLEAEMEMLTDLIRTRLITSLLIGSYRASLFPENREYLLISQKPARNFLFNLKNLSADEAVTRIHKACHTS